MKAGWWEAPLALRDLAEAISIPNAIKQIELLGQVKQINNTNNNPESVYLTILEKIKETRLKLSQGSVAAL